MHLTNACTYKNKWNLLLFILDCISDVKKCLINFLYKYWKRKSEMPLQIGIVPEAVHSICSLNS